MPRDNEHKTYKEKWACFHCRKCFKQRVEDWHTLVRAMRKRGEENIQPRVVLCPQCRQPLTNMGWDFKVPKQKDIEQWKKVELLARNGYRFHSRHGMGESHKGPGPRPARLRDVEAFLKEKQEQKDS